MNLGRLGALALTALVLAGYARAEVGVGADKITFAQVAALDGPAAELGLGMRAGLLAAFEEANRAGGVHGRQLTLESRDDGYEPDRSIEHTEAMIAEDRFFAFIGTVGTPTNKVIQPITTQAGVPLVGPFTGAGFLRDPGNGNVWNVRGSYDAETEQWVAYLADQQGLDRIAILYQDDSFGRAGLSGVNKALGKRGMKLIAEGTYVRNTTDVKTAFLKIREAEPEAVVMVGAYKPVGEFIKLSRSFEFTPEFVTISFVGSEALANELWPEGAGVVISQVVPFPWDEGIPLVKAYQAALKETDKRAGVGFVSLEGYVVGRVAIEALKMAGPEPTREAFISALSELREHDLGGLVMSYGPSDNQGVDEIFMTRLLPDGFFEPM
ncbi:MAG: ABC transporter substrate-binding protein [Pseudomonadota bacterium]